MDIHADVAEGNLEISKDYELVDVMMEKIMEGFKKAKKRDVLSENDLNDENAVEPFDAKGLSIKEILLKMKAELHENILTNEDGEDILKDKDEEGSEPQTKDEEGGKDGESKDQKDGDGEGEKQKEGFEGTIPGEVEDSAEPAEENEKAREATEALSAELDKPVEW